MRYSGSLFSAMLLITAASANASSSIYLEGTTGFTMDSYSGQRSMFYWHPGKHAFRAGKFSHWQANPGGSGVGEWSFVFGDGMSAGWNSPHSLLFGENHSISNGAYSLLFGSGQASHNSHTLLFGHQNETDGLHSMSVGRWNQHPGSMSTTSAAYSYTFGYGNEVYAEGAVAMGFLNTVAPVHGYALGYGLYVSPLSPYAFVVGKFNESPQNMVFAVGVGSNGADRENAMTVYNNGLVKASAFLGDGSGLTNLAGGMLHASGGHVGIGTSSPASLLSLQRDVNSLPDTSTITDFHHYLSRNTDSNGEGIGLAFSINSVQNTTVTPGAAIIHERVGSHSQGKLHMKTTRGTASNAELETTMTLDHNGNVGIGTTDPQHKLDVNGTIQAQSVILHGPSGDIPMGIFN